MARKPKRETVNVTVDAELARTVAELRAVLNTRFEVHAAAAGARARVQTLRDVAHALAGTPHEGALLEAAARAEREAKALQAQSEAVA